MTTVAGDTVSGTLSADGSGTSFQPIANQLFNVFITGTFSATATVQRSYDAGTTWVTVPKPDLSNAAFTAPVNFLADEAVAGTLWRVTVSGYASGSVGYRFQQ